MSKWSNTSNLPAWAVRAIQAETYSRPADASFTVTELLAPAFQRRLWIDHGAEVTQDVADQGHRLLGTAVHAFFEKFGEGAESLHEERLKATVTVDGKDYVLSGATDVMEDAFVADGGTLWDLKTTKAFAIQMEHGGARPEHVAQCNILRRLWENAGFSIAKLGILVLVKDWSEEKAKHGDYYPPHTMLALDVPVWTPDQTRAFVESRIRAHVLARSTPVESQEPCSGGYMLGGRWQGGETWQRKPGFAIAKPGKKCVKLADSPEAAEQYIQDKGWSPRDYEVTRRDGEFTRCSSSLLCGVRRWCPRGSAIIRDQQFDREMRSGGDDG